MRKKSTKGFNLCSASKSQWILYPTNSHLLSKHLLILWVKKSPARPQGRKPTHYHTNRKRQMGQCSITCRVWSNTVHEQRIKQGLGRGCLGKGEGPKAVSFKEEGKWSEPLGGMEKVGKLTFSLQDAVYAKASA